MSDTYYRIKAAGAEGRITPDDALMASINEHTLRPLTPEEIFVFKVALCNNEIDRDNEAFTSAALTKMALLFLGKTIILDHSWSAEKQMARIVTCSIAKEGGRETAYGEPFDRLDAICYMLRTDETQEIIRKIEGGILKEVSVAVRVAKNLCSICGKSYYSAECIHRKGAEFDGKSCYVSLDEPVDAYEVSFVAVPAQPAAGVHKEAERDTAYGAELRELTMAVKDMAEAVHKLQGNQPSPQPEAPPKQQDNTPDREVEALIRGAKALIQTTERETRI